MCCFYLAVFGIFVSLVFLFSGSESMCFDIDKEASCGNVLISFQQHSLISQVHTHTHPIMKF